MEIKITHPPVQVSVNPFPYDIAKTPLPLVMAGGTEGTPSITKQANHVSSSFVIEFILSFYS